MKFVPLILAGLWRKPLRTILTMLAIIVAFVLFGVMHGVIASFDSAISKMSETRLRVTSRANLLESMPLAHQARIARVPGVHTIAHASILVGYYQDPKNGISAAGVDMDSFLDVFPDIRVPVEQRDALRNARTGAVAGSALAERFGWQLGDRVTLHSPMWIREDGSADWTFDIVALANTGPDDESANEVYFHYAYFDEARAMEKGTVHQYIVSIDDPAQANTIAQAIDREFANSSDETLTMSDKEYLRSQIRQVGDVRFFVNAILGAVLFTLLFLTGNTMMQSVRDRVPELGVMKSVGFTDDGHSPGARRARRLTIAEALSGH